MRRTDCLDCVGLLRAKHGGETNLREKMLVKLLIFEAVLMSIYYLVAQDEAPSGLLARGHYDALSKFVDDDDHTHLKFEWSFNIAKEWK